MLATVFLIIQVGSELVDENSIAVLSGPGVIHLLLERFVVDRRLVKRLY